MVKAQKNNKVSGTSIKPAAPNNKGSASPGPASQDRRRAHNEMLSVKQTAHDEWMLSFILTADLAQDGRLMPFIR